MYQTPLWAVSSHGRGVLRFNFFVLDFLSVLLFHKYGNPDRRLVPWPLRITGRLLLVTKGHGRSEGRFGRRENRRKRKNGSEGLLTVDLAVEDHD
jgi:hypothetical protein